MAVTTRWSDNGLVFPSTTGTPLDPANVRKRFKAVAKRAGIEVPVFPYLMRHSVVSLLIADGATAEEVADVAGDDPRTIHRFYRHRVSPIASATRRMDEILAAPEVRSA